MLIILINQHINVGLNKVGLTTDEPFSKNNNITVGQMAKAAFFLGISPKEMGFTRRKAICPGNIQFHEHILNKESVKDTLSLQSHHAYHSHEDN